MKSRPSNMKLGIFLKSLLIKYVGHFWRSIIPASPCVCLFLYSNIDFWVSPCPCKVYVRKIVWNRNMSICQKDMVNSPLPKAFPHLEPAKDNHIICCFYSYHIQNAQIMTCTLEFGQIIIFAQLKYPKA